jgi:hypothetical protein
MHTAGNQADADPESVCVCVCACSKQPPLQTQRRAAANNSTRGTVFECESLGRGLKKGIYETGSNRKDKAADVLAACVCHACQMKITKPDTYQICARTAKQTLTH